MRIQSALFYLVFIFKSIKHGSSEGISNSYNFIPPQRYNTARCIQNILTSNFLCGTITSFVNLNKDMDGVIEFTNNNDICFSVIVRSFEGRKWLIWTNLYIISANDLLEFWTGIHDITRDVFWNPRAKFIIQIDKLDNDEVLQVFKILLKYRIYKVVLLKILDNDALVYTYNPFLNNNCGKSFDEIVTLDSCETSKNFSNYLVNLKQSLNNCTFNVVASDDVPNFISESSNYTVYGKIVPGLEQYVLDTIAAYMGFSVEYEVFNEDETYGIVLPNLTATGLLYFIDTHKADIAAGGYIMMENRVGLFDYLYGFNYAAFCLYTPSVGAQTWKIVYREFSAKVWSLIFGAFGVTLLVSVINQRIWKDKTMSILNLWGYFFLNANKGLSLHPKFRTIIGFWAWFAFFINNFYNTALFSLTSVHVHESPHSISVEKLITLPYKPCISDNSRAFFEYAYNQSLPKGEAINKCMHTDSSLKYAATTKKYYAIVMEYSYKLKEYNYLDRDDKPLLDSWTFSSSLAIVMYLSRGFPYRDTIQKYASRLYEGGLVKNHNKIIQLRSYSVLQRHPKQSKELTLADVRIPFYILFGGFILSFICFLLEIAHHHGKRQIKCRRC